MQFLENQPRLYSATLQFKVDAYIMALHGHYILQLYICGDDFIVFTIPTKLKIQSSYKYPHANDVMNKV